MSLGKPDGRPILEMLERRLLLSSQPVLLSIDRQTPSAAVTEATSVTYAVAFNVPVTGVTAGDFPLALTGETTASPTVVVSPTTGYNTVYSVTVNGISGDGTLGLNLANNSNIVDQYGDPLSSTNGSLEGQHTYAVGKTPVWTVVADLTGDGKLDLVVTNYGSNTVSVLMGNGNGTFQSQSTFAVGAAPDSVAVADLNGDGKLDLVVANYGSNTVSVLLGNGDGTFQAQKTYAAGTEPTSVAIGDLNGDGKPDLAVTDYGSSRVSVLLGNGDGTFQAQKTYAVGTEPRGVVAADVNGDGKADLVVSNWGGNTISVLLGNGDGTFQAQTTFATGSEPDILAVADVNGDGKPDVVVPNQGAGTVSVLLGNGDGTFQTQKTYTVGSDPECVAVADMNGDGKPNLVVANEGGIDVGVLYGNGDGSFQAQTTSGEGLDPRFVTAADLNGDGAPEHGRCQRGNRGRVAAWACCSPAGGRQAYTIDQPTQLAFAAADQRSGGRADQSACDGRGQDVSGNTVICDTSNVTLTLGGGTFSTGSNTATVAAVAGIATFSNLIIDAPRNYTLTAGDGSLTGAASAGFAVSLTAAKLAFTAQPGAAIAGVAITPAVAVAVENAGGFIITSDNSTVTVTLNGGVFASGSEHRQHSGGQRRRNLQQPCYRRRRPLHADRQRRGADRRHFR